MGKSYRPGACRWNDFGYVEVMSERHGYWLHVCRSGDFLTCSSGVTSDGATASTLRWRRTSSNGSVPGRAARVSWPRPPTTRTGSAREEAAAVKIGLILGGTVPRPGRTPRGNRQRRRPALGP